ncbi:TetR/AcrR family transcriptional regulator [Nocardioides ferulae]|uniref:TetR/AcrR family transcriptional regulator n=1 Tax=Nocardioides ferulae TaxID=2340821 RepID=UPI0013DE0D95|nr:helix-turn-helix domain-containing protein [Nocardioides ferulae]
MADQAVGETALLEAALAQFALTGVRRTSTDDIARRAGVNRATLYRRLGSKEQIVAAALLHESSKVLARIEAAIGDVPAPGDPAAAGFDRIGYVVRFFATTLAELRGSALLRQLLEVDREDTLAGLTVRAGDVLELSSHLVADRVRALRLLSAEEPPADDQRDDVPLLAVTLARLAQSLVLTVDGPPRLDTDQQVRDYAELVIAPMILR